MEGERGLRPGTAGHALDRGEPGGGIVVGPAANAAGAHALTSDTQTEPPRHHLKNAHPPDLRRPTWLPEAMPQWSVVCVSNVGVVSREDSDELVEDRPHTLSVGPGGTEKSPPDLEPVAGFDAGSTRALEQCVDVR